LFPPPRNDRVAMTPFRLADALRVELPIVEVLDIGARQEGEDRYAPLLTQNLARVTGFEPEASEFERLEARPGPFTYFPHVLGAGGRATMHVTRYPGCSSLLEPDPAVIDLFETLGASPPDGNFLVVDKVDVETVRLDDVPGLRSPDYIKIDVQGTELQVLTHGPRTLSSAVVVQTEVEFLPIYKNQPLFGDMQCFLREQGFVLHKLIDIGGRGFQPIHNSANPFQAISQVLWADAVFVRNFVGFDQWTDEGLLKAALILNDIYRSYDLVFHLLRARDARLKENLADRYLAALSLTQPVPLYFNLKNTP
jgi:FkbM family methyltransferase